MWVRKHDGDEARLFPLVEENKKLPVRAIAAFWKLDPSTLCIGEDVVLLSEESSGNSVFDAEAIVQTARSLGLGDGSSKEAAVPITGKPRSSLKACGFKSLKEADEERRKKSVQWGDELHRLFYGEGAMHAYSGHIRALDVENSKAGMFPVVEREVCQAKIIGWLHVVKEAGENLDTSNRVGMVTLVRPDGTCVTSETCMGTLADGERYVVHIGDRSYECSGRCSRGVGILEPINSCSQGFSACASVMPPWGTHSVTYSAFCEQGTGEVRLVEGLNMGYYGTYAEVEPCYVMMAKEKADIELGAPVLSFDGSLSGVVVGFGELRDDTKRKSKSKSKRELATVFPESKGDFTPLIAGLSPQLSQKVSRCVEVNLLVYYVIVTGKVNTPLEEWRIKTTLNAARRRRGRSLIASGKFPFLN